MTTTIVCTNGRIADVALQAASLLATKLGSYYDCRAAPAVLQPLLEVADTTEART